MREELYCREVVRGQRNLPGRHSCVGEMEEVVNVAGGLGDQLSRGDGSTDGSTLVEIISRGLGEVGKFAGGLEGLREG